MSDISRKLEQVQNVLDNLEVAAVIRFQEIIDNDENVTFEDMETFQAEWDDLIIKLESIRDELEEI